MSRRVLALLLLTFVTAALSAQFPIAEPRIGLSPGNRGNVNIAASNEQYLLVWADDRGFGGARPWAARMSKSGALLDPTGIPLDESIPSAWPLNVLQSVASDGTDFLVAVTYQETVRFIRVTRDGLVQRAPDPGFRARYSSLAWIGDRYAFFFNEPVDWRSVKGGAAVALLDRNGRVLTGPRTIIASDWSALGPKLTSSPDGSRALLVWSFGEGGVQSAPVSLAALRAGSVQIARNGARVEPANYSVAAASSPTRHFLLWEEEQGFGGSGDLRGRILNAEGAPLGEPFRIAERGGDQASVTWNGSRFVVAYNFLDEGDRRLVVAEFDESGQLLATPLRPRTLAAYPHSATLDGETLVAWMPAETDGTRDENIRADIVSGSRFSHPARGILVSQSLPAAGGAQAVWRGGHYLALWGENAQRPGVMAGRLDVEGRPLDGSGRRIADGWAAGLASDGRDAVVVHMSRSDTTVLLHSLHIAHDGRMTDRAVEVPPNWGYGHSVIWTGNEYAFCSGGLIGRVAADGTILQVDELEKPTETCNIAWTGSQYIVAGTISEFCFPSCIRPTTVWAQSYSRHLVPVGSAAKLSDPDASGYYDQPRLAVAGDRTLLVWQTKDGKLRGLRIAKSGFVLDPLNGFEIGAAKTLTEVYADGENWIVGSGPYARTVSRDGSVSARVTKYSFVPEPSYAITVRGGPATLVLYQTQPGGAEQVHRLVGRFVIPARGRVVRR